MARLDIIEFRSIGYSGAIVPQMPPSAVQSISLTSDASTSAAFSAGSLYAELDTDTACFVTVGTTVAPSSTTGWRLPAGASRIYGIQAGQKIRAIATS